MKKRIIFWIILALVIVGILHIPSCLPLIGTIYDMEKNWKGPHDGLWYCEDLQMQLNFGMDFIDPETEEYDTRSYVLEDGKPKMCSAMRIYSNYILYVDDEDYSDPDNSRLGRTFFEGELVSLDAQNYVVRDKSGTHFTFKRIDEFSREETLRSYRNEIDKYNGSRFVGKTQHIVLAVEHAKELWKTELGMDTVEGDITVAFELETASWLVSTTAPNPPMVLIDFDGTVFGVWQS